MKLGPFGIVLWFLRYVIPLAALAVTIDAFRRPAADFGDAGRQRWAWAVPQAALVFVTVAGWAIPGTAAPLGGLAFGLLLLCVPLQVAYLFAVAFPKRPRAEGADDGV